MTVRTLSVPHVSGSSQSWQNILYLWPLCLFVCVSLFVWAVRVEMGPPSVSTGSLQQGCCHLVSQASICGALCRSDIWAWVEEVFQGRWGDISYTLCSLSLSLSLASAGPSVTLPEISAANQCFSRPQADRLWRTLVWPWPLTAH